MSAADEAERRKIWAYVQHSLWLEGFTLSDEDKALFERYVRGEITWAELHAAIMALVDTLPEDQVDIRSLVGPYSQKGLGSG